VVHVEEESVLGGVVVVVGLVAADQAGRLTRHPRVDARVLRGRQIGAMLPHQRLRLPLRRVVADFNY
jgi:hypothetical protein